MHAHRSVGVFQPVAAIEPGEAVVPLVRRACTITWRIDEAKPPDKEGNLTLTAACAAYHPELAKPFEVAERTFADNSYPKD